MSVIHQTTMAPTKLELLTSWLPGRPWYRSPGRSPALARAGGFRLDDPAGEVGIEFMVVADGAPPAADYYLVPLTYRGEPLAAAEPALIGTSEHGVLGRRWIYDGTHDPVLLAQLVALIQGGAVPQAQSVSDTPDPTVTAQPLAGGPLTVAGGAVTGHGPLGTELRIDLAAADGEAGGMLALTVARRLEPGELAGRAGVTAVWRLPDGALARGVFATARLVQGGPPPGGPGA